MGGIRKLTDTRRGHALLIAINGVIRGATKIDLDDLKTRAHGMAQFIEPDLSTADIDRVIDEAIEMNAVTLNLGVSVVDQATFIPWLRERKQATRLSRSNAYLELLLDRKWSAGVVERLDEQTDQIAELVGDPKASGPWSRRGLAMGEVQSGKTSTYISVLAKAIDYGYKVLVVIGGHTEDLRRQTQGRLDSDLTGLDSAFLSDNIQYSDALVRIGIGKIDAGLQTNVLTTTRGDFSASNKRAGLVALGGDTPTVFVVKKNAKVLQNLAAYLKANMPQTASQPPLLLIDDESDWASININDEDNVTKVNAAIRDLLASSNRNSYLGITATPFANIFIDDAVEEDLFPRDYIQTLESPSNYSGVSHYFRGEGRTALIHDIDDTLEVLPYGHKRTHVLRSLPASVRLAVCSFCVGTAVRRIREGTPAPASMLINVSRFNDIQARVEALVQKFATELNQHVNAEFGIPLGSRMSEPTAMLRRALNEIFPDVDIPWDELKPALAEVVDELSVQLVNSQTKAAREKRLRETPKPIREAEALLPTIYVGGDVLARGLTLDGLQVSYYVRRASAADTLLQMGRWFGYRPGYDDLVRIWIDPDVAELFRYTSQLSEELRDSLSEMNALGLTPKDFGIKLRRHPEGFMIASARKMRNAVDHEGLVSVNGQVFESTALPSDQSARRKNLDALVWFVSALGSSGQSPSKKKDPLWRNVPQEMVHQFLLRFRGHPGEPAFGGAPGAGGALAEGLGDVKNGDLWDVALISGSGPELDVAGLPRRRSSVRNKGLVWDTPGMIRMGNRRVAAGADFASLFSESQLSAFRARGIDPGRGDRYLAREVLERPTLLLYAITTGASAPSTARAQVITPSDPLVGVVAYTPSLTASEDRDERERGRGVRWKVNPVFARLLLGMPTTPEEEELEEEDE